MAKKSLSEVALAKKSLRELALAKKMLPELALAEKSLNADWHRFRIVWDPPPGGILLKPSKSPGETGGTTGGTERVGPSFRFSVHLMISLRLLLLLSGPLYSCPFLHTHSAHLYVSGFLSDHLYSFRFRFIPLQSFLCLFIHLYTSFPMIISVCAFLCLPIPFYTFSFTFNPL